MGVWREALVCWVVVMAVVVGGGGVVRGDEQALQGKCAEDFGKLTDCLDYAAGKAEAPSGPCCADTGSIQQARPVCLCFIIQQAHNGSQAVQSLGLRFDRLLAMPKACSLPNANVTMCINLLNLTSSSPDYALFLNATKFTPSRNSPAGSAPSGGFKVQMRLHYTVAVAIVSAIFSSIF